MWPWVCWNIYKNITLLGNSRQCDQIGRFLIFLATNFLAKLAQIIGNFCSQSVKPHSCLKNESATFWATFVRKYWATFYSNMRAHVVSRRLQQNIIIQKLIIFKVSTINVSIERLGAQAKIRKKNHCFHMMQPGRPIPQRQIYIYAQNSTKMSKYLCLWLYLY